MTRLLNHKPVKDVKMVDSVVVKQDVRKNQDGGAVWWLDVKCVRIKMVGQCGG